MLSTWLRGIGGVLQIAGVILIALELRSVRRQFPRDDLGRLRRVWRRLFGKRPAIKHVQVGGAIEVSGAMSADVETWNNTWAVERQIEELKQRIAKLQKRAAEIDQSSREQGDAVRREVEERAAQLNDAVKALDDRVGDLATGSLRIRWLSLVFLVLGITLTTWPTEIASWVGQG